MTTASQSRRLTALLASGIFAAAILFAVPTLRFGFAESAGSPSALVALADDPLVGERAGEALLEIAPPRGARARVAELDAILSQRPLSGAHWLQLARARYETGEAPEKYFKALEMSQLTGPNEASTMAGRAVFGLSLWSLAAAKMRHALLIDLVGGWPQVSETRRILMRAMFAEAEPRIRAEVAAGLSPYGVQGADVAMRLGLEDGTRPPPADSEGPR